MVSLKYAYCDDPNTIHFGSASAATRAGTKSAASTTERMILMSSFVFFFSIYFSIRVLQNLLEGVAIFSGGFNLIWFALRSTRSKS